MYDITSILVNFTCGVPIATYFFTSLSSISGLVVKFPLAMREPRVRFPADAF